MSLPTRCYWASSVPAIVQNVAKTCFHRCNICHILQDAKLVSPENEGLFNYIYAALFMTVTSSNKYDNINSITYLHSRGPLRWDPAGWCGSCRGRRSSSRGAHRCTGPGASRPLARTRCSVRSQTVHCCTSRSEGSLKYMERRGLLWIGKELSWPILKYTDHYLVVEKLGRGFWQANE